ncbi:class I SAM-dependent methyltransferase [Lutibacter sp. TH_r2]|uniref:class I SAM-dependent methyltransferase n=1 Tax=Lutibacter sp. TH_r2 TaxID=3082083 RepID=UPI0029533F8C|nr:class I SAM-dependent methyltransferase [Lutibacter sp. TH_r2]MDV7186568.1 class I SAM-dependent methyltransferase [Lutibacter sp. TH_r2]
MSDKKSIYLALKDYSVSGENFELMYNSELDLLETSPKPLLEKLPFYYESEDYISHTDSKKSLQDKVYQFVKSYALKSKLKLINSFQTEDKNLLDVGCGTGDFLLTCKNNGWNVVGVEPNLKAKNLTKEKLKVITVFETLNNINSKQFDVITLWHVLEHVPDLDNYISKLKSLLKPNGVLVIAVPNYKSFDASYYKNFWAAFDVPRHLWHFSQKSISILFSKVNLKVEKVLPMYFDSFYVSLLSEKYKNGNSNFIKAFFIGLRSNLKAITSKEYSSLIYILKADK